MQVHWNLLNHFDFGFQKTYFFRNLKQPNRKKISIKVWKQCRRQGLKIWKMQEDRVHRRIPAKLVIFSLFLHCLLILFFFIRFFPGSIRKLLFGSSLISSPALPLIFHLLNWTLNNLILWVLFCFPFWNPTLSLL